MAQTVVPKFYTTRKKVKDSVTKSTKTIEKAKLSEILKDPEQKTVIDAKKSVKKSARTETSRKKVNKITDYLKAGPETSKGNATKKIVEEKREVPRSPKRNLTPEELTPSKKKPLASKEASSSLEISPSKLKQSSVNLTPKKQDSVARKKLFLSSPNHYISPKKFGSPVKKGFGSPIKKGFGSPVKGLSPQKAAVYENLSSKDLESMVNESRSKILFSGRQEELKKSLESFLNVSSKTKEFQSNSFKITSVISSAKQSNKEPTPKGEPAYKKFSYLATPKLETSFVLPAKYKLLGETFRCLDTVVKMIHNRKEKITFEKVKHGVQDMMKRNFVKDHLGQIMSVFPEAYSLEYEKCDSYTIKKNSSLPAYQLIITPNFSEADDNTGDISSVTDAKNKKNNFISMMPQHLLERQHIFEQNLIAITKKHHQAFLEKRKFLAVSEEKLVRWHPAFPVDSVPDIPVGGLPEEPDVKVYTARDVLNKLKGSVCSRVEKALQSVSDGQESESNTKSTPEVDSSNNIKNKKQSSALHGICSDLLERIRARESAKIIESMTRSVEDEKRSAMLEKVPKIVNILWQYFVAERKKAIPVDIAIEKIIHSFNSLTTPDAVKEHLQLIRETMPGWLSFIKISKGEYITIDKKKDINLMLANIK